MVSTPDPVGTAFGFLYLHNMLDGKPSCTAWIRRGTSFITTSVLPKSEPPTEAGRRLHYITTYDETAALRKCILTIVYASMATGRAATTAGSRPLSINDL